MLRREFLTLVGSSTFFTLANPVIGVARAEGKEPVLDDNPIGGYVTVPPKAYLFTDHRLVAPGDLMWMAPDGTNLPLNEPPEPVVEAHADWRNLPRGIRLVAQKAQMDKDRPGPPGSVLFEDGIYRACSMKVEYPPGKNLGSYSTVEAVAVTMVFNESDDCFHWNERGRCKVELPGQTRFDGFTWFIDPHGDPKERFKAVYMAHPPESEVSALWEKYEKIHPRYRDVRINPSKLTCIYGLVSPNGVDWAPIKKSLFTHYSDTDTSVYYDNWLKKYVMYTRLYLTERRMIAIAEADDFRHWGPVQPLIWPGLEEALSTDIYTNGRTSYPGMPEVHLMFPMFYHRFDQTSEIRLFSSIDGLHWNQVPGGPVLEPGDPTEWRTEFIVAGKSLVPIGDDKVGIPFYTSTNPHKYPRWPDRPEAGVSGWVCWPKGRLVALTADEDGSFWTFPLPVMGRELRINARTRRAGMIRVGIGADTERSIDNCDPIIGDNLAHKVTWKGDSSAGVEVGESVSIKFFLRKAELFGFEWVS